MPKPLQAGSYGGEPVAGYGLHGIRNQGMYDNSQNSAFLTRDDVTQDAFWPAMNMPDLQPQGITVADYLLKGRLYMLTDGVTACADGREASRLALKTVGAAFYAVEALPEDTAADRAERLRDAVWGAHNVLLNWEEKLACWRHGQSIKIYSWDVLSPADQSRHACPLCQKTLIGLQCAIAAVVLRGPYASYVSCGDNQILYVPANPDAPIEQLNRPEKLFLGAPGLAIGQLQMGQRKLLPGDKLVLLGDGIVDMLGYGRNKADWHTDLRQRLQAPLKHQDGKQDEAYEQFPRLVRMLVEQTHETATRLHAQTDLGDDMSIYALGYPDKAQLETYIRQGESHSPNPDQLARYLHYIDDSAAYDRWRQLESLPRRSAGSRQITEPRRKTQYREPSPLPLPAGQPELTEKQSPTVKAAKPREEILEKQRYFKENPNLLTTKLRGDWADHCRNYLETAPDDAKIKEALAFFVPVVDKEAPDVRDYFVPVSLEKQSPDTPIPTELAEAVNSLRDVIFASVPDAAIITSKITDLRNALLTIDSDTHYYIPKSSWASAQIGKEMQIVLVAQRQAGRQQEWTSLDDIIEIANTAVKVIILYTQAKEITPETATSVDSWLRSLATYDNLLHDFDKLPPYYRQAHSAARYLFVCSQYAQAQEWTQLAQHLSDNSRPFAMGANLLANTVRHKKGEYARYLLEEVLRATPMELLGGLYKVLAILPQLNTETDKVEKSLYTACQAHVGTAFASVPSFAQLIKAARPFYGLSLPGSISTSARQGWHTHKRYFVDRAWQAFIAKLYEANPPNPQQLNAVYNELANLLPVSASDTDDRRLLVMKYLSQMWQANNPLDRGLQQNDFLRTAQSIRAIEDMLSQLAFLDKDPHKKWLQQRVKETQAHQNEWLDRELLEKIPQGAISDNVLTSIAATLAGEQYPPTYLKAAMQIDANTPEIRLRANRIQLLSYAKETEDKAVRKSITKLMVEHLNRLFDEDKHGAARWSEILLIVLAEPTEKRKPTTLRLWRRVRK